MSDVNDEKSPFFDKRDEKFIKLVSNTFFYEMFNKKKMKCDLIIPQSILFSNGQPIAWYFNSVKEKTPVILRKNQDKLHLYDIAKHFVGMGNLEDYKAENLISLNEYMQKTDSTQPACVLKYVDGKHEIMSAKELVKIFANDETYYVEFRLEDITLQGNYKFYKKSPVIDLLNNSKKSYFKYLDESMNKKLQSCCQVIMMFIEKAYKVKVRKLVAKYLIDVTQKIFFLGCEKLMIDVPPHSPYEYQQLESELRSGSNSFNEFVGLAKAYKKKNIANGTSTTSQLKLPKVIVDNDKQYSQKLYKQLRLERCRGDFCDYQIAEQNKGFLIFRKHLMQEYTKHFTGKKKNDIEVFQMQLPHEISNQLILKARQKSDFVVDLFFKNRIFSKDSMFIDMSEEEVRNNKMEKEKEYPFILKNRQADNYENLYKNVKICKNCFTFYQLLQDHFDKDLQSQMKVSKTQPPSMNQTATDGISNKSFNFQARSEKNINIKLVKTNSFSKINTTITDQSNLDTSVSTKLRSESNHGSSKVGGHQGSNNKLDSLAQSNKKSIKQTPVKQSNENSEEFYSHQKRDLKSAKEILAQLENNDQMPNKTVSTSALKPPLVRKSASSNIKVRFQRQNSSKGNLDDSYSKQQQASINQKPRDNQIEPIQRGNSFFQDQSSRKPSNNQINFIKENNDFTKSGSNKKSQSERPSSNVSTEKQHSFFEKVMQEMNTANQVPSQSKSNQQSQSATMTTREMDLHKKLKEQNTKSTSTLKKNNTSVKQENSDHKKDSKYLNFLNYDKQNRLFRQQDSELQNLEKELKALNKNITLNQIDLTKQNEEKLKSISPSDEGGFLAKQNEKRKAIISKAKNETEARLELQNFAISNFTTFNASLFSTVSKFQPSQNLQHLRKLPAFLLNTPMKPYSEELNIKKIQDLNLNRVIELMNYPQTLSDTTFLDQIKYCIIDKHTAVPYLLLGSESKNVKTPYFNLVCLDFFDSFLEYRQLFIQIQLKFPDQSFLFFNYPGQAHTIFKEEGIMYNSDYHVKVIDQLLFDLSENHYFDGSQQKIRCIGFGYGTFILQTFIIQSSRHLQISSACFYNSISRFDKQLKETLKQSLEVFECTPNDMPDLSFSYYSSLCNSKPLNEGQIKAKMKNNPIFNKGRCLILQGSLDSNEIYDKFCKIQDLKISLIHSLKNCLVSITQSEDLLKIANETEKENVQQQQDSQPKEAKEEENETQEQQDPRQMQLVDGNHCILEDNREQLLDTLCTFLLQVD